MNKKEYLKITERFLDGLEAKALQSDTYFTERNKLYIENKELKDRIDKTVKYIEEHTENIDRGNYYEDYVETYDVLKLLKGDKE